MTQGKFRKRPIEVEAFQWNGQPPHHWPEWARHNLSIRYEVSNLQVDTNHGATRANKGDWVIYTAAGEVYPCTAAEFTKNYEPVE